MTLHKKDMLILKELLEDSRILFSDLGRKCRMSRQTAFNRVKFLKRSGIVEKFTIKPNFKKLGLDFMAYILVSAEPGKEQREKFSEFLRIEKRISQVHYLFGRFDFFLEAVVSNREELSELLRKIHSFQAVKKTETFIVYDTLKYEPEAPVKHMISKNVD